MSSDAETPLGSHGTYRAKLVRRQESARILNPRSSLAIRGEFNSGKRAMNFRRVFYSGLSMRSLLALLESDDSVISYQEAPPELRWSDGRRFRMCRPVASARLRDRRLICILMERRRGRLSSDEVLTVREVACGHGYDDLEVWSEADIYTGGQVPNAMLLGNVGLFEFEPAHLHTVRTALERSGGRSTIRDLRISSRLGTNAFRTIVKLIALGEIVPLRPNAILDDFAIVQIPKR